MTDQEIIYKAISEVVNTDKPDEFAAHNSTCYTIAKYVCEELRKKTNYLPAKQKNEELEENIEEKINEYWNEWFSHGEYFEGTLPKNVFAAYCHKIAQWQKEQILKSAVSIGYLQDWYQNSIDGEVPPIWTNEHLNELTKDFYLIPKQKEDEQ